MMGGLINGTTVKGDLWMVDSRHLSCYQIATTAEGPGPRVGHASLIVGNAFIVFGGDTTTEERDVLDDTLYLLNTGKRPFHVTSQGELTDESKQPDNGPERNLQDLGRRVDMAIP